jgi:hypothetical protein
MSYTLFIRGVGIGAGIASLIFLALSPAPQIHITIPSSHVGSVYTHVLPYSDLSKEPRFEISAGLTGSSVLKKETRRTFLQDGTPAVEVKVLLKEVRKRTYTI